MKQKLAVIFGGTGFIGRHIVRDLAADGYQIKIATRVPESAYALKPLGDVGQIVGVACDYGDYDSIARLVEGADVVVNCIGILFERKKGDFIRIHAELAESIATACAVSNVSRFVHLSALGVDQSSSEYAASKRDGEARIAKAFPNAIILRPSIVFGEDDDFFNKFASMARFLPALPLIGGGHTLFQPVFVGDVAQAVMSVIHAPASGKASPLGQVFELGGPEVLSFKEIYQKLFHYTGAKRCLVPLPFGLAKVQARVLSLLPTPLLTVDQVESLKSNSVCGDDAAGFESLGIVPTHLDVILPHYLVNYRAGGRFAS